MSKELILIFFLSFLSITFSHARISDSEYLYVNGSKLFNLTDSNFNNVTRLGHEKTWFIMFYAPWCPHCKRMMPVWLDLANNLTSMINLAIVDCDSNRNVKERFTINAYPSLVLVSKGKYYEYKEKRDPESLIKFALEDFLALEGEEIPMEPNFFRSAYKSLGKVTIIAMVVTLTAIILCCICMCMSKDEEENEEEQQDEKGDYKKVKVKKAEAKDE